MAEFEKAKAFLKQAGPSGATLYDHLANVLLKVVKDKPGNALQHFENLSVQVKKGAVETPQYREFPAIPDDPELNKQLLAAAETTAALILPKKADDDDAAEPDIPDMMAHSEMFEWAGVGLGREESYKVMLSIQQLAKKQELVSVRFFGKVLGTGADYYICEAKKDPMPEEELEENSKQEAMGTGSNEFLYFVTNSPEGKWSMLPNVTPDQITTARQMRRFFSGNLSAPVLGFPRFPWGEASYLRAQIARISHATLVHPKGFYQVDDEGDADDPSMIEAEEYTPPTPADLAVAEGWAHHRKFILKQGRTKKWIEPPKDDAGDDDAAADEKEPEEEEETPEFLGGLEADENKEVGVAWSFRVSPSVTHPHAVSSVHSVLWPGAVTVAKAKTFASIYVGFGHKHMNTIYTPPPPPPILSEFIVEFNADEGEKDPLLEQTDPLPPPKAAVDPDVDPDDPDADPDADADGDDDQ